MDFGQRFTTIHPARRATLVAGAYAALALLGQTLFGAATASTGVDTRSLLHTLLTSLLLYALLRWGYTALDNRLQALQDSQARMRSIIASIDDLVFVFDNGQRYIEINQPDSDALYLPSADILGKRIDEIGLPVEVSTQFMVAVDQLKRGEKPAAFTYELCVPAGKRGFNARVSQYNDHLGRASGYIAVIRDVTEARQAELAVSDERNFSRRLIDSLPGLVFVFEPDGRLLLWNQGLEKITGYRPDEFDQFNVFALFSFKARALVEAHVRRVIGDGYDEGEAWIRDKTGQQKPFYLRARRFNMRGRTCLLGIGTDLSPLKASEAQLRASEARFRSLFEHIPNVAVQGYDRERRVIFWNAASEALYGYSASEALGQPLETLIIPPAARAAVVADIERWRNTGEAVPPGPLELQHKNGSPVHVFSSHVMQRNRNGDEELYCLDIDLTPGDHAWQKLQRAVAPPGTQSSE